nr:unnamed protein product [Callosobruchus analis]
MNGKLLEVPDLRTLPEEISHALLDEAVDMYMISKSSFVYVVAFAKKVQRKMIGHFIALGAFYGDIFVVQDCPGDLNRNCGFA